MFEKELSGYAFNITKRYTGDKVKLNTLLSDAELPEEFKKFAEAEVEEYIEREGLLTGRTGKFDLSTPDIQALFKEIRHILKSSYEFPREEFMGLAEKASKFVFNFVIRPRWTLEKFLFKGEQKTNRAAIVKASRVFNCYTYYPKGIIEYLDFHGRSTIDIETWRKLHSKIDEHLINTLPEKLESLTAPLFNLFRFSSGETRVPSDAIILYFRDKSAGEIVDRVEFTKDVKNIRTLDLSNLASVLEATASDVSQNVAVLPQSEDAPKEFKSFELKDAPPPVHPEEAAMPEVPDTTDNEAPGGLPSFENGQPGEATGTGAPRPAGERRSNSPSSVRHFMSAKLEEKVVRKIFHGSKSGYQIALHRLDECGDWQSASKIVEGVFIDNDTDPFSKYAVAFTDAVSAKFRSVRNPGKGRQG